MNPIKEWLARVAAECGSPLVMRAKGSQVANQNSRKLIMDYADHWSLRLLAKGSPEKPA